MKTHLLVLSFLVLGSCLHLSAQAPKPKTETKPSKPREFGDIIKSIPKSDLSNLRGNKKADAVMEISKKLTAAEAGKEGTFRVKVDRVEPWLFQTDNVSGWRIDCANESFKESGVTIGLVAYVYFRQDPDKKIEKIRPGREVVVSGTVSRAGMTTNPNGNPQLNVDIQATGLGEGK